MVCGLDTSSGGTREAVCLPESTLEGKKKGWQQAIVIVDPLSSGAVLAQVMGGRGGGGLLCIRIACDWLAG